MTTLTPDITTLALDYIAADVAMREATRIDPSEASGTSQTHRRHVMEVRRIDDALAALGAKIGMQYAEGDDYMMCGVEVKVGDDQHLVGRKSADVLENERRIEERRARRAQEAAERERTALGVIGMTLAEIRAVLGRRAIRDAWTLHVCRSAAEARLRIAGGDDGAGTWDAALYGQASEEGTHCIAVQGVGGADAARARWQGQRELLTQIAAA